MKPMKTIIFLLILLCLPFSVNWGQEDSARTYYWDYLREKARADSLEKKLREVRNYLTDCDSLEFIDRIWRLENTVIFWQDSTDSLNQRLAKCEAESDSAQWPSYWRIERIDTTWDLIRQSQSLFNVDTLGIKLIDTSWRPIVPGKK